ncbi:MAG: FAD-dependent oxidoreductase [Candidatus Firestonebacteria bacterium]|nr:FAD-dependent oxidoreductase [Candidatus Firestonebacteria bacterium]
MDEKVYELIIIGGGPAGVTASVYAARKQMDFILITKDIGGQAAWSGDIENYTGYQFVTGPELALKFEEHVRKYNFPIKENEEVVTILKEDGVLRVKTDRGEYISKTLIIASGKRSRELNIPGEKELKNRGVAYCATCDGPLFSGKTVAVVGGGNSALDAALQLVKIAVKVHLINNTPSLGGDKVMQEKLKKAGNVIIYNNSKVENILGEKMVSGIIISRVEERIEIPVQGVFVEIGLIPNSDFAGIIKKNGSNEILVNNSCETNISGIFAAGDVTDVPEKQIIIAAGDGAKATLSAFKFLSRN